MTKAGCRSIIVALVLLVTAGSVSLSAQAASDGPAPGQGALSTYTNDEYHFTFQYPSRLKPDLAFTTQRSWTFLDPGNLNGKSLGFGIFRADNTAEGGGDTRPWFAISQEVRVGISPDVSHCYSPGDATLPTVGAATINGVDFKVLRADPGSFSAMHTHQDATSYRVVHAGACFAVESVTSDGHEAATGTSGETPRIAAAAQAAAAEADAIIHTFRFTDLSGPGAASVGSSPGSISVPPGTGRVGFAAGATQGVVTGRIDAHATVGWLLGASADQPLMLNVESANHDLTLSVADMKSQAPLFNTQPTPSPWRAMLPDGGDYLIEIHGGATGEQYRLSISTPARITFEPGAVSAALEGRTPGGLPLDFVLRVQGGQTISLALHATGGAAALGAYALGGDGTSYVSAGDRQTSARFTVWHDEDCILEVVPTDDAEIHFTLDVTIPPERG